MFEGNFTIFEGVLTPMRSIDLDQAQQLISIMEYLYQFRIIHRDIRPRNIMIDPIHDRIKLIDFGFAAVFKDDEDTIELDIQGAVSFAGIKFLKFYSKQLAKMEVYMYIKYEYERTFDLECSINVIMCMRYGAISDQIESWKDLSGKEKVDALYELWFSVKQDKDDYSELLDLIANVSNVSDFQAVKDHIKLFF